MRGRHQRAAARRPAAWCALAVLALALPALAAEGAGEGAPPPAPARRAVDASIVPPERRTLWNPGIPGGVPEVEAIHRTLDAARWGDGERDATEAIERAIEEAGDRAAATGKEQVVLLPPGTYRTTDTLRIDRSGVVLRGAGRGRTILHQTTAGKSTLSIGAGSSDLRTTPVVDVVGDVPKGASTLEVEDASGFSVGDILQLDQLEDGDPLGTRGWVWRRDVWWSLRSPYAEHPNMGLEGKFPDSPGGHRPIAQRVEVLAKKGNVLTIHDPATGRGSPAHLAFPASQRPQVWRVAGAGFDVVRRSGVEDLTVRGTAKDYDGIDMIQVSDAAYCWIKGVESDGAGGHFSGRHVHLHSSTYRCVVRDSYLHHSRVYAPGGNAYGILYSGSDCLVENNILYALNKPLLGETTGGGNVVAYNYVDEAILGDLASTWQETGVDACHGSFCHSDLFEGNLAPNLSTDATHGNAGWMTFFRNHATGRNGSGVARGNLRAIEVAGRNREHSSVGNVLLTPALARGAVLLATPSNRILDTAVYRIGANTWDASGKVEFGNWDDGTALRLFRRHMDFDHVTGAVHYDPSNPVRTLPDSLYLAEKPAFFGALRWPWVDPLGKARVHTLPAKARFDAGTP